MRRIKQNFLDLKQNTKKGFTLMELIVVLVILAILAAIMIPSMLGWIDRAREKQILLQARSAYIAAQTVILEDYGYGRLLEDEITEEQIERAKELALCKGTIISGAVDADSGTIINFVYEEGDYRAVYQEDGVEVKSRSSEESAGWTITKQ